MEIAAQIKFAHISPKKVQPLLGDLRRKPVVAVLSSLKYARTKAGKMLYKVIASAVANAANNYNFKPDNLKIKTVTADEGPRYKRYWFRSHGSADVQLKRMTHITVILEEIVPVKLESKAGKSGSSLSPKTVPSASTSGDKPTPTGLDKTKPDPAAKPPRGRLGVKRLFTRTTNK